MNKVTVLIQEDTNALAEITIDNKVSGWNVRLNGKTTRFNDYYQALNFYMGGI